MRKTLAVAAALCILMMIASCGKKKDEKDMLGKWDVDVNRTVETVKKSPRYLQLSEEQKKQVPMVVEKLTAQSHLEIKPESIVISIQQQSAAMKYKTTGTEKEAILLEAEGRDDKVFHITVNFLEPDVIQFTCPEAPELATNVWKRAASQG